MAIQLIPYLHFGGNCEEVLNFYKSILAGTLEIVSRYDSPQMNAPENYKNKVLHARFSFDENEIYASDVFPGQETNKGSGDMALSLSLPDPEQGKKIFNQLADGGNPGIPFEKQFWGAWHGNLTDKYGIRWMVNS